MRHPSICHCAWAQPILPEMAEGRADPGRVLGAGRLRQGSGQGRSRANDLQIRADPEVDEVRAGRVVGVEDGLAERTGHCPSRTHPPETLFGAARNISFHRDPKLPRQPLEGEWTEDAEEKQRRKPGCRTLRCPRPGPIPPFLAASGMIRQRAIGEAELVHLVHNVNDTAGVEPPEADGSGQDRHNPALPWSASQATTPPASQGQGDGLTEGSCDPLTVLAQ